MPTALDIRSTPRTISLRANVPGKKAGRAASSALGSGAQYKRRAVSRLSIASGSGSIISVVSNEELLRMQRREHFRTVLLKQKELRLLKKMVTIGLGEDEVPPFEPVEVKGTFDTPSFGVTCLLLLFLSPLVWAPEQYLSHGVYAAVVPALCLIVGALPTLRAAVAAEREAFKQWDHHERMEKEREHLERGESPLGSRSSRVQARLQWDALKRDTSPAGSPLRLSEKSPKRIALKTPPTALPS
mmetsp:Transcript_94545/g.152502  ORF Transcript_94545/g.152502 Transcript_94545/m.152502 type:complete len:243 (+) Transcript_94545:79-807(+)